jgi:hypothetical protein
MTSVEGLAQAQRDWVAELRATTDDEERFTGLVVEISRTAPDLAGEVLPVVREFAPDWEGWATELFASGRRTEAREAELRGSKPALGGAKARKAEVGREQLADWFDECRRGISDYEERALTLVKYGLGEGVGEAEVRENFRCARLDRATGIVVDWEAWRREEAEPETKAYDAAFRAMIARRAEPEADKKFSAVAQPQAEPEAELEPEAAKAGGKAKPDVQFVHDPPPEFPDTAPACCQSPRLSTTPENMRSDIVGRRGRWRRTFGGEVLGMERKSL